MKFEIIAVEDVVAVKRGRKSNAPAELVEAIRKLGAGNAVRIADCKGNPKDADTYKKHKASVGAMLRACAKSAGKKISIHWSPDGIPQITVQ